MDNDFEKQISAYADELLKDPGKVNSIAVKINEEELGQLISALHGRNKLPKVPDVLGLVQDPTIAELTWQLQEEWKKINPPQQGCGL
jgi:hypothetical protein